MNDEDEPGERSDPEGVEIYELPDEVETNSLKYKTPELSLEMIWRMRITIF